jgi:hypothetical protein
MSAREKSSTSGNGAGSWIVALAMCVLALLLGSRAQIWLDKKQQQTHAPVPYALGKWRAAPPEQLDQTLLFVSHILIRHDRVRTPLASFNAAGWRSPLPPASRNRREASVLAEEIAEKAQSVDFAALAREHSEDVVTAVRGGSLGGVSAGHLAGWPEVLDAIEALPPGGVSRPVETEFGFHVLRRRAPVPEQIVSGSHIVIAHDDAPWIELSARGPVPKRSRAEAWRIATRLYERLRERPADFARLAREHSEHRDAVRGGDFGTFSTREVAGYPREIETLAGLDVHSVAEPIDTLFGYQIIQRTPNRERRHYAMSKVELSFNPNAADADTSSRASVMRLAQGLAREIQGDPLRFGPLQEQYCCVEPERVIEGRDVPELEAELERLLPGEAASVAIEESGTAFVIPKRLELDSLRPVPATRVELPGPVAAPQARRN